MQDSAERTDSAPEPYAIAATASLQDARPLVLKQADGFAVFDGRGDIRSGHSGAEGVYWRDTRHLSRLVLLVERRAPLLLSSSLRDDNATMTCDLTNPDVTDDQGQVGLAHDLIHIRRSRFLWKTACFERIHVRNFDDRPRRVELAVEFAADFSDLFEVRGFHRARRGVLHDPKVEEASVVLGYTGLDDRLRATELQFDPRPDKLDGGRACYVLDLEAGQSRSLFIEIECRQGGGHAAPAIRAYFQSLRDARRQLRGSMSRAVAIQSSNDIFNEAASRSIADLYMLITQLPEGPYPYAGIPWYSTVFGRDAIITALEMLWVDPSVARGVLGRLAATQATAVDDASDAEPGKILHEARHGEMADLGEVPFRRYYGSVDATPLFVMLAGAYLDRTGHLDAVAALWPHIKAALDWIETYGDRDGDGFVEYGRRNRDGLVNQGWKDSHDAIFHADGSMAKGPIALVEVQGYVYAAWRAAAQIVRRLGRDGEAAAYDRKAEAIRAEFDRRFFDEALGAYVLALDGDKRPCRVRASNAGHALFTGIALPERAPAVVATLMGSSSFCGWGVRTIASTEARYNPMSYHNGSVWPHDNALIAEGFARYGFRAEAARIFEGLFSASTYVDLRRLPELLCGFPRKQGRGPTFYPVACMPQAWAAAAPLSLVQSCLGLTLDPGASRITFTEPTLPPFLDWIVLKGLAVGGAVAEIGLWRSDRRVVVDVLDRQGAVSVVTTT